MPFQEKISIEKNTQGDSPRAVFAPDPLDVKVLDQVFWSNQDSEPHWPGLVQDDGTIDETFFMPNQIAPDGDSSAIFAFSKAGTFEYACSLHPDETPELQQHTSCADGTCTVTIPGYFKMRSRFVDFTGQYVVHCHILAHEDRGMMQLVQVVEKPKTMYDHH